MPSSDPNTSLSLDPSNNHSVDPSIMKSLVWCNTTSDDPISASSSEPSKEPSEEVSSDPSYFTSKFPSSEPSIFTSLEPLKEPYEEHRSLLLSIPSVMPSTLPYQKLSALESSHPSSSTYVDQEGYSNWQTF